MKIKPKKSGFTLVETLTVLVIITVLLGLLLPAFSRVRRFAKETKQKVQITNIGLALTMFKNEYGAYPPSSGWDYTPSAKVPLDYCGAHKLTEALLGWDLAGFHPYSQFVSDGGGVYSSDEANLRERKDPYLKVATTNTATLYDLFVADGVLPDVEPLDPDRFVLCDVFGVKKITLGSRTVKMGAPILYYRANISSKRMEEGEDAPFTGGGIYDYRDNAFLVGLGKIIQPRETPVAHPLGDSVRDFYEYIKDPRASGATGIPWPYRPQSYLLISAGVDGKYGTPDDITNF